jgi:hypothetical protein
MQDMAFAVPGIEPADFEERSVTHARFPYRLRAPADPG